MNVSNFFKFKYFILLMVFFLLLKNHESLLCYFHLLIPSDISIIGSNTGVLRTFDLRSPEKFVNKWNAHSARISALGIF
jgi:hypothetical protein